MSSKEQIIQLRTENPLMNSVQIGKELGVSKQYVHKILKREGLNTSVPKRKKFHNCLFCNDVLYDIDTKARFCNNESCHFQWTFLKVACSFCTVSFYRKRSALMQNFKRKWEKIYCSPTCRDKGRQEKPRENPTIMYRQQQDELDTINSIDW